MRIALCAIGRRENRYAREFVEHYLALGFDHIFICDNNHDGEEHFEDVLQDFIDRGVVSIRDYRNRVAVQMQAYTDIYARYGSTFDWMAFFDFDEFLTLRKGLTLQEWLTGVLSDADTVFVNWMCYGDCGLVYDDGRGIQERFTVPLPKDLKIYKKFPENEYVKCLVRGSLSYGAVFDSPHYPKTARRCYTAAGRPCRAAAHHRQDHTTAWLRHYTTKTIEEWMRDKMQKGVGSFTMEEFTRFYGNRFFLYNERTLEKETVISRYTNNGG